MDSIVIVGAGISGLALAYFFQKNGFTCQVLERDQGIVGKNQGFSLTMQGKTEEILEKYGLLKEIYECGSPVHTQKFYDGKGELLYIQEKQDEKRFNYPLPRQNIREIFYKKLSPNTVLWNKQVLKTENDNTIICSDGTSYPYKLLFACDGLNSKLNNNLKHNDLKLMNIYGIVEFAKLDEVIGNHFKNNEVQILDGFHRFFSKPYNNEFQMWELTYPYNKNDKEGVEIYEKLKKRENPRGDAKKKVMSIVHGWGPAFLEKFIESTVTEKIIVHPLYDHIPTAEDIKALCTKNKVLIGDSIHPMSPFIGMGANQAIVDAYNFVELAKSNTNLDEVIDTYNKEMIERTTKSVIRSRENTEFYHTNKALSKADLYAFKKWPLPVELKGDE